MRKAGSNLADPDTIKNRLDNYVRVAQLTLKWNDSPVHWRGLNRAIISYCTQHKEPVPDWKNLGFVALKSFLQHLAGQNHIRFIGDHIVHPDNEGADVDVADAEDEVSEDTEPQLNRSSSSVFTHAKAISSPKLKKSGSFSAGNDSGKLVNCPICQRMVAEGEVNRHLDECLNLQMLNNEQTNGANNAANNGAAVPNNNNPKTEQASVPVPRQVLQYEEDDVGPATRSRQRGLGKRRRSSGVRHFVPNKRARFFGDEEENEDDERDEEEENEEEEENMLLNNNNRMRVIADQLRTMQARATALQVANQTNQVQLSDSDDEENEDNEQGGGDSRFAEKILDRNLTDKDCIICYMPLERGQLVATMPCFCQFHKTCLLDWFQKREVCPTHSEMSM